MVNKKSELINYEVWAINNKDYRTQWRDFKANEKDEYVHDPDLDLKDNNVKTLNNLLKENLYE